MKILASFLFLPFFLCNVQLTTTQTAKFDKTNDETAKTELRVAKTDVERQPESGAAHNHENQMKRFHRFRANIHKLENLAEAYHENQLKSRNVIDVRYANLTPQYPCFYGEIPVGKVAHKYIYSLTHKFFLIFNLQSFPPSFLFISRL